MKSVVVIHSGGLDSTVALYLCRNSYDRVESLSFNYHSKHNEQELFYAAQTCKELNIKHTVIDLFFINDFFKSSLLKSGGTIPNGNYNSENMKSTVVPFRNGILLSIAAGYAESNGFNSIVLGNHAGDHYIYPDCRPEFIKAMSNSIKCGTTNGVDIVSPFCSLTKGDIVKCGSKLGVDFSLTYSCYKGGHKHCGVCGTCRERKEAFASAGIEDKTEYER